MDLPGLTPDQRVTGRIAAPAVPKRPAAFDLKGIMAPLTVLEELIKPFTLALRLFGNIFAGGLMVALIGLLPATVLWLPNAAWKLFDLFIGLIQAFIFALLTILYFSQSMELDHDDEHKEDDHKADDKAEAHH